MLLLWCGSRVLSKTQLSIHHWNQQVGTCDAGDVTAPSTESLKDVAVPPIIIDSSWQTSCKEPQTRWQYNRAVHAKPPFTRHRALPPLTFAAPQTAPEKPTRRHTRTSNEVETLGSLNTQGRRPQGLSQIRRQSPHRRDCEQKLSKKQTATLSRESFCH